MIGAQLGEDAEDDRGGGRDRDRPRPVGAGAGRGRLQGVRGQPVAGGPLPGTARRVGRQERRRPTRTRWPTWSAPTPTSCARSPVTAAEAEAVKVVARAHKTLIWERTRHMQRLRHALREYFPAALEAFEDLDAADALELLAKAPDPASAARLTLQPDQRGAQTRPPPRRRRQGRPRSRPCCAPSTSASPRVVTAAYAATVRAQVAVLATLNDQINDPARAGRGAILAGTRTLRSTCPSPGSGPILGARVLAEFGDDPRPLRRRQSPQELRRHQPDHPRVRQEEGRAGPLRPQRPARRRPHVPGLQPRCTPHPAPAPTTTSSAPAASATTPPCASSPTASSASCTAASRPAPPTTKPPPGRIAPTRLLLDIQAPGMSDIAQESMCGQIPRWGLVL